MIPNELTLNAVQNAMRDMEQRLALLTDGNVDMKQRRIINAGKSIGSYDYVTRLELNDLVAATLPDPAAPVGLLNASSKFRFGAFSTRGSPVAHADEAFIATDRDYITWVSTGAAWIYICGVRLIAQSAIATFTADLTASDAGVLINVLDYTHMLRWTGSGVEFAPGDPGSGYIVGFPISPPGGTWGLCNGSAYDYLLSNGTTASFTTPDYSTAAYLKFGTSATIGPTAAGGVTTSVSGGTPAGTVSQPTFTGDAVAAASTAATPDLVAPDVTATGVSPVTTATGTVSTPTFTGNALAGHTHGPDTLELRRTLLIGYFRR